MEKHPLDIDLTEVIEKLKSFPITKMNQFDRFLLETANYVYYAAEFLCGNILESDQSKILIYLPKLMEQTIILRRILVRMEYDSKNMDRLMWALDTIVQDGSSAMKKIHNLNK